MLVVFAHTSTKSNVDTYICTGSILNKQNSLYALRAFADRWGHRALKRTQRDLSFKQKLRNGKLRQTK